jgi:hypothetical protein
MPTRWPSSSGNASPSIPVAPFGPESNAFMQPSLDVSGRKLLAVLSPKYVHVSLRSKWDALKNSQLTSGETYRYLGERTLGEAAPALLP